MSHYLILNTLMSTYDDEVNEKGGIRGANHRIDELSRVDDLMEVYRINVNSAAIENRERLMIIKRKKGSLHDPVCHSDTLSLGRLTSTVPFSGTKLEGRTITGMDSLKSLTAALLAKFLSKMLIMILMLCWRVPDCETPSWGWERLHAWFTTAGPVLRSKLCDT